MQLLHVFMQGLLGSIPVLDEGEVSCYLVSQFLGNGLSLLGVKFMVVKLQVNLANVNLVLIKQGQFIGPVGYLRNLQEGPAQFLLIFVLDAEEGLQLFLLGIDLHGESLIPLQLPLFDEKGSCLEGLLAYNQPDVCASFDGIHHQCLDYSCLYGSLWGVAVIFYLSFLLLILENADGHFSSLLAHVGNIEVDLFVNIILFPQINQTNSQKSLHSFHLTPNFSDYAFHFRLWKLEMFIEDVILVAIVNRILLCLIIELSVLEDNEGRTGHVLWPYVIKLQLLDEDVQSGYLNHPINLNQGNIHEGDTLLVAVEDLYSFVWHFGFAEGECA